MLSNEIAVIAEKQLSTNEDILLEMSSGVKTERRLLVKGAL